MKNNRLSSDLHSFNVAFIQSIPELHLTSSASASFFELNSFCLLDHSNVNMDIYLHVKHEIVTLEYRIIVETSISTKLEFFKIQ